MRPRSDRGQAGATLVEVLMMLMVAVPLVLTASLGMFSAVDASSATTTRQHLEATLSSYGESLRVMPAVAGCATAADVEQQWSEWADRWQPEPVRGAGLPELRVLEVTHWDPGTAAFADDCEVDAVDAADAADAAQRIVVQVRLGEQSLTGTIVKRALT